MDLDAGKWNRLQAIASPIRTYGVFTPPDSYADTKTNGIGFYNNLQNYFYSSYSLRLMHVLIPMGTATNFGINISTDKVE